MFSSHTQKSTTIAPLPCAFSLFIIWSFQAPFFAFLSGDIKPREQPPRLSTLVGQKKADLVHIERELRMEKKGESLFNVVRWTWSTLKRTERERFGIKTALMASLLLNADFHIPLLIGWAQKTWNSSMHSSRRDQRSFNLVAVEFFLPHTGRLRKETWAKLGEW